MGHAISFVFSRFFSLISINSHFRHPTVTIFSAQFKNLIYLIFKSNWPTGSDLKLRPYFSERWNRLTWAFRFIFSAALNNSSFLEFFSFNLRRFLLNSISSLGIQVCSISSLFLLCRKVKHAKLFFDVVWSVNMRKKTDAEQHFQVE